jgi:predicted PurR-regulated permease PerM
LSEAGRTLTTFGVDIDNLIDSERIVAPDKAMTLAADFTGELVAGLSNWGLILVTAALFLFEATKMPEKLRNIMEESGPQVQRILRFNQDVRYFMSLSAGLGLVAIFLAIIPPAIMAYIQFGVLQMVVVVVGFLLINQLINSSIKMRYLRSRLNLSALVIFLSLMLWGWVFGPIGAIVAVPIALLIQTILASRTETNWIAYLMGEGHEPFKPEIENEEKVLESGEI